MHGFGSRVPALPFTALPVSLSSVEYRLKAFISHMGSSAQTGHYICHIKKDGHWAIFNDRKVARSQKEPRELAYVYIYETVAE